MSSVQSSQGLDINSMFETSMNSISEKGKDIQTQMEALMSQDEVSPEDMLAIQFEMGNYSAMLESLSSITKSVTDSMKSIAQRQG